MANSMLYGIIVWNNGPELSIEGFSASMHGNKRALFTTVDHAYKWAKEEFGAQPDRCTIVEVPLGALSTFTFEVIG